jgi:hypothetical protein
VVQRVATAKVSYPEANATLVPLHAVASASGTTEIATARSGVMLVPATRAFAGIRTGISRITAGDRAGPVVGGLYAYYNSAYGQILPNGQVKLKYQGTPVWLFTAPLVRYMNDSQAGPDPNGAARPVEHRTGCSYIVIVDAKSGTLMTWWRTAPAAKGPRTQAWRRGRFSCGSCGSCGVTEDTPARFFW